MGRKISAETAKLIKDFLAIEVGEKVMEGITYQLYLKDKKNEKSIQMYKQIREKLDADGYAPEQVFRIYADLPNGYIFDCDLKIAIMATIEMAESLEGMKGNPGAQAFKEEMPKLAAKRRQDDMKKLAIKAENCFKEGKTAFEVALFSKNDVNKIIFSGKDRNGKPCRLSYDAYAIRHWDIGEVNAKYLSKKGLKISRITPYEILPTLTGVRFLINVTSLR